MKKVILYSLLAVLVLYFCEQFIQVSYLPKTLIKLILFIVIPMVSFRNVSFRINSSLKSSVWISLAVCALIIATYLILQNFIDITNIQDDLSNRMKITPEVFIFPAMYTIFVNSFVEEYFFRGYVFNGLKKHKFMAYVFSALLFALYHIAIFRTWFTLPVFLLALLGLFCGGLIFAYYVDRTESFLSSYLIHMSADIGIVLVGLRVLNII